jgi:sugar transferase (PEP-CTERM/EpsH1 system associated)
MHVLYKFGVGGMEVGITKLVNALDPALVQSSVCSSCPGDSLKERLRPGIPLHELDRRGGNHPGFVLQLYRLLKREQPDVLHTHRWATLCEGLVAARLAGVPFVVHGEHGTLETRRRNTWIQRRAWNHVDQVLSVSSRLAERMAREVGFPLERIRVIRNGVDLRRFGPEARMSSRAELGIRADELVIGAVGRLVEVKDYPNLLAALRLVQQRGIACRVIVAGTGPLRDQLERLATSLELEHVTFLGNRSDVDRVLASFDIFVLSSRSEGLSNTIQEAMATGLPVVATHVGGADELVEHGRTGLLVPPANPQALADAIASLAQSPSQRNEFGAAGRRRAEALFELERMIREYEGLYLSLANGMDDALRAVQVHEA